MLEVQDIVAERRIHELRVPIGKADDETGTVGIMLDCHSASRQVIPGRIAASASSCRCAAGRDAEVFRMSFETSKSAMSLARIVEESACVAAAG